MKYSRHAARYLATPGQAGAYAVEFALTFVVFFAVCYAILTYAFIFTAQHLLNVAADDAARIALRWQPDNGLSTAQMADIRHVVDVRTSWLASARGEPLEVAVCFGHAMNTSDESSGTEASSALCAGAFPASGAAVSSIGILVRYPYRDVPLVPLLGPAFLVSLAVPEWLSAFSVVTPYRDNLVTESGAGA
ncbi:TadE/TadG family type IV pilus assembly protein [Paracandidimonas soli]|uniref:TadE-like protein n=1 Tax=Paracandidimonas soli TaxID=1917182 RepID=A0A4R3VAL3_9BURK|nr:TadE family protein [Paracandidimonas soli]TCV00622.1 TadE-like protein [Paracandidimonas soli]